MKVASPILVPIAALCIISFAPGIHGREIFVDEPGDNWTVSTLAKIPNVYGYPSPNDPPLMIMSDSRTSILRYYDSQYLEGGQPVLKEDIYVTVTTNCTTGVDVKIERTEYNRSQYDSWDTKVYTESISISITADESTTLVDSDFGDASSYLAFWNYTSFFCAENQPGVIITNISESSEETKPPVNDTGTENLLTNDENESAGTGKSGVLGMMLAAVGGAALLLSGNTQASKKTALKGFVGLAIVGAVLVNFNTIQQEKANQLHTSSQTQQNHGRRLQDEDTMGETCSAQVEIIVDGCRRSMFEDRVDLVVEAPDVRVLDVEITPVSTEMNGEDPCTTDYVALLDFSDSNLTSATLVDGSTDIIFAVPSLVDDWQNGVQCSRPVEGRPFIDVDGTLLQARIESSPSAWSAEMKDTLSNDEVLGQEWAERALGEHASVPAFAAFTIALMSNNAPPKLVEDALMAAMDELRHAKTSFEVASMLLGTTIEPGPIPPSTHHFEHDLTSLAIATAQEGCVDETLSALVAAYEVDVRLEQNARIDDGTKAILKDKMTTIALEETRHSALAWRTVHWACKMDSEVCDAVKAAVFDPKQLEHAFVKRFQRYNMDEDAHDAWKKVYFQLIPFALNLVGGNEDNLCTQLSARSARSLRDNSTLLEAMSANIILAALCNES